MCGQESLLYGLREKQTVSTSLVSQRAEGGITCSPCWQQWTLDAATLKDKMKIQNQKDVLKEKAHLPSGRCTYLFQCALE